jgi:hypothetical protein
MFGRLALSQAALSIAQLAQGLTLGKMNPFLAASIFVAYPPNLVFTSQTRWLR